MLQYLIEHGKMDEWDLQKTYEDMKRKEKLRNSITSKISKGKDGKWRTYVNSGSERKLLKYKTKEGLERGSDPILSGFRGERRTGNISGCLF